MNRFAPPPDAATSTTEDGTRDNDTDDTSLNHILRLLLIAVNDECSSLSALRGHGEIIKKIYSVLRFSWNNELETVGVFVSSIAKGIRFPAPTGINVNMMPFIYGDKSSLPKEPSSPRQKHLLLDNSGKYD